MKKIVLVLLMMVLLPMALIVGCNAPAATSVVAPVYSGNASTATHTPTITPTGTITPQESATPQAKQTPVILGTTANFSVLAFSAITNTGTTNLCGNLGLWSGSSQGSGYVFCAGSVEHITDLAAQNAQGDLTVAIGDVSGRSTPALISGDLGGLTLYRGLYQSSGTLGITGDLTLDAQLDPNAVFIFQIASTLATSVGSQVILVNGAKAANVYWQVGANCSLGNYSIFKGTIMSATATTIGTGANVEGRALAKSGVTLDTDTVNMPTP